MIKIRHLICTTIAAAGLMLSASHSFAQQADRGDEPGLVADDRRDVVWQSPWRYRFLHGGSAGLPHANGGAVFLVEPRFMPIR